MGSCNSRMCLPHRLLRKNDNGRRTADSRCAEDRIYRHGEKILPACHRRLPAGGDHGGVCFHSGLAAARSVQLLHSGSQTAGLPGGQALSLQLVSQLVCCDDGIVLGLSQSSGSFRFLSVLQGSLSIGLCLCKRSLGVVKRFFRILINKRFNKTMDK